MNGLVIAYWALTLTTSPLAAYDNVMPGQYPSLNACEQAVYNINTSTLPVAGVPRCVAVWTAPPPAPAKVEPKK